MTNNKFSASEMSELNRLKELMNYGRVDEKKAPYSGIENTKVGADGKTYGIIREGAKFYIKVSEKKNPLVENFEYIGGFRNRKDYEYTSFASAQKNFDMKLMAIKEAYKSPEDRVVVYENKGENNQEITESTQKMRDIIARQRQIVSNVALIGEGKSQNLKAINEGAKNECNSAPFCEKPDQEFKDAQKPNMKGEKHENGNADKANKDYKKAEVVEDCVSVNEEEVLGWNRNEDYMDKSHGTEIGDSAPFDDAEGRNIDDNKKTSETGKLNNGVVEEGESMHDTDNQNSPAVGTGEVGDTEPFDGEKGRAIDEAIEDIEDDNFDEYDDDSDFDDLSDEEMADDEEALADDEEALADDEAELGDDEEAIADDADDDIVSDEDTFDDEIVDDAEDDDIKSRLDALEDIISKIADKLGVSAYEDEDLYDDEDGAEYELEMGDHDDLDDDDEDFDAEDDDTEDEMTFESRAYKAMKLNEENRLNDFGKHPAYQKKIMTLPPNHHEEKPDYYDMNDDSVYGDAPYGRQIGDSAPFDIDPESIDNAIAESFNRLLKKKR